MTVVPVGTNRIGDEAVREGEPRLDRTLCGVWQAVHPHIVQHPYAVPVYSQGLTVQMVYHRYLHLDVKQENKMLQHNLRSINYEYDYTCFSSVLLAGQITDIGKEMYV